MSISTAIHRTTKIAQYLLEGQEIDVGEASYRYLEKGNHIEDSNGDVYETLRSGVFSKYTTINNGVEGWRWILVSDNMAFFKYLADNATDDEFALMAADATLRSFHNRGR